MRFFFAFFVILLSIVILEFARQGVEIKALRVGETPVTHYALKNADGPIVVVAHGFAGSQQMMQGYALPLARAGYRVFVYEFLGHGRHKIPMSGDVTSVDGTTRLLVEQTHQVVEAVKNGTDPIALLGHSMASDILVRVAADRDDIGPTVLISAFSQAIDFNAPKDLLLITGAWEPRLRAFGVDALRMVDQDAIEGTTALDGPVMRRAITAPFSEHVSVLQSRVGRGEALRWIDRFYERKSNVIVFPSGWAILGLLGGFLLLVRPITVLLPMRQSRKQNLSNRQLIALLVVPTCVTPLTALLLDPAFLPVLVADYLILHLMIFGGIQLAILFACGVRVERPSLLGFVVLLSYCVLFGAVLNRYVANFWPTPERLWIITVMLAGAVPYMIADAMLIQSEKFPKRFVIWGSFLVSLGIAVAFDSENLFFLIMIAPVLVLFYVVFGTMGKAVASRAGPLTSGLALGCVLAWALGVSFPLLQS